jgi:hypothetical protein
MYSTEIQFPDPADLSIELLVGQQLTGLDASSAPNFWMLQFDGGARLGVATLWRVVADRVVFTSEDHAPNSLRLVVVGLRSSVPSATARCVSRRITLAVRYGVPAVCCLAAVV